MGCVRSLFLGCTLGIAAAACVTMALHQSSKEAGFAWQRSTSLPADGISYHYYAEGSEILRFCGSDALVIDVDLTKSRYIPYVAADHPDRKHGGQLAGKAHTVLEWCKLTGSPAGINGGYFGETIGGYRQIEGMLISGGKSYGSSHWIKARAGKGPAFTRCAFAMLPDNRPVIGWAVSGTPGKILLYPSPVNTGGGLQLKASSAISCGPRLIADGEIDITDKAERLVSSAPLPRTFLAYDVSGGKPLHFVMGISMTMTYKDVALFLQSYFRKEHHSHCAEAMCLDGGGSSQLVYRNPKNNGKSGEDRTQYVDSRPSLVPVPTAILLKTSNPR